jgi:hypothetical protein
VTRRAIGTRVAKNQSGTTTTQDPELVSLMTDITTTADLLELERLADDGCPNVGEPLPHRD